MGSVSATVKDYKGGTSVVVVEGITTPTTALAKKLAEFLVAHSDAQVVSYGCSLPYTGDECDSGKYDRVEQRLTLLFSKEKGGARRFSIPAPRDEDVNVDQEPNSDLPEDVMDLFKSLGIKETLIYNGGGMLSRMPKVRARAVTGV